MNEYDEGKIWFRKKGKVTTVGLTEKAFDEIGGVQGVMLPVEGDEVSQDDVVCEIEGEKTAFELICPVDGVIEAVNETLNEDFELLESDPLDEGWIFKIRAQQNEEDAEDESEE